MSPSPRGVQKPPKNPVTAVPPTADPTLDHWIQIVRGEYLEIPGLLLTRRQVQRLWGFDAALCDKVLDTLIESRFLRRTNDDGFLRMDAGRL